MGKNRFSTAQIAVFMAALTMISRGVGFIRELLMANYYGAGMVTDAYVMASQMPGTLLAAVMTAFGTAYMPIFSEKNEKEGVKSAELFTSRLINFLFIVNGLVILCGILFAKPLVSLFANGFDESTSELTVYYLRIAFLLLAGNVLISIFVPYLQYRGRMLITVVFDFTYSLSIIVFIFISVLFGYHLLIWGVVVGYAVRGIAMAISAKNAGFNYSFDFKFSNAVKEAFVLALPIFIGGSLSQINTFIDRMIASGLPSGSVAALSYGNMIVGFILSFSAVIIISIVYPKLNMAFATENYKRIGDLTESATNLFALLCIPFTLGSMVYSNLVIQVIYERGAFSEAATDMTATAFFYYSAGLFFLAVNLLLTRVFYSMHDTKTAVYCSVVSVVTNIILNYILAKILGIGGIALATSIAQCVNALALFYTFRRKYPHIELLKSKRKLIMICLFSCVSVAVSYIFYSILGNTIWMPRMVLLGVSVCVAILCYMMLIVISKFEEVELLVGLIKH